MPDENHLQLVAHCSYRGLRLCLSRKVQVSFLASRILIQYLDLVQVITELHVCLPAIFYRQCVVES